MPTLRAEYRPLSRWQVENAVKIAMQTTRVRHECLNPHWFFDLDDAR